MSAFCDDERIRYADYFCHGSLIHSLQALTDDNGIEGFLYNLVITELTEQEARSGTTSTAPVFVLQAFLMYRAVIKLLVSESAGQHALGLVPSA